MGYLLGLIGSLIVWGFVSAFKLGIYIVKRCLYLLQFGYMKLQNKSSDNRMRIISEPNCKSNAPVVASVPLQPRKETASKSTEIPFSSVIVKQGRTSRQAIQKQIHVEFRE